MLFCRPNEKRAPKGLAAEDGHTLPNTEVNGRLVTVTDDQRERNKHEIAKNMMNPKWKDAFKTEYEKHSKHYENLGRPQEVGFFGRLLGKNPES